MPGQKLNGTSEATTSVCRRCDVAEAKIIIRSEPLCEECFKRYVQTKVVKKLDAFRVRNAHPGSQRKLLLPVSLGVSSCSLLHVVDQHSRRQFSRTGRAGFELHVLHVIERPLEEEDASWQQSLDRMKKAYPSHQYHTTSRQGTVGSSKEIGANLNGGDAANNHSSLVPHDSPSSQADLSQIQLVRTVASKAKTLGCEGILWGHTTTRLAERVLAETAKGRGFSSPWLVKDGPSPFDVDFLFPMRDLLKKEVEAFAKTLDLSMTSNDSQSSAKRPPVSSKNTSIDGLMKEYFESVERDYPSIVANVVRTSSKLKPSNYPSTKPCELCGMPADAMQFGTVQWSGHQGNVKTDLPSAPEDFCYGCARLRLNDTGRT